ncbi:hypothetical protein [Streptomyces sp. NPDC002825]|uniref:hypothetical protein n=1 Tax=Streptomyces sp. NPDC002825 TaxID=3154666 RepID=UPI00331CFDF7
MALVTLARTRNGPHPQRSSHVTEWGPRTRRPVARLPGGGVRRAGHRRATEPSTGTIPSVGTAWDQPGPYEVTVDIEAVHTFYHPKEMGGEESSTRS